MKYAGSLPYSDTNGGKPFKKSDFAYEGITTPKQARKIIEEYKSLGIDLYILRINLEEKISIKDVREFKKNGIGDYETRHWVANGYNAKEAKKWLKLGVTQSWGAKKLKKIGIKSPEEYKAFRGMSNSAIKFLKDNGVNSPDSLDKTMLSEIPIPESLEKYDAMKLKIVRSNCYKVESVHFGSSDVYDNEGKCYLFKAKLYQRLERIIGLAVGASNKTILVMFDKPWSEGEIRLGVIKGYGNYTYQTTYGSTKNIAKGKVILNY